MDNTPSLAWLVPLVPPVATFILGNISMWFISTNKRKRYFRKHLAPLAGTYTVHRKSGKQFPHMRELIISWNSDDYQALQFEHEKHLREETADKEIRGSKGAVYFEGPKYGYGFYKSNSSDHYGTAAFMLFDRDTIGFYRVYVRDDDTKPHMVSTGQEISTQFILKRKK